VTLPTPNLDDRDFEDLVRDAHTRVVHLAPEWNDLSPSDPGIVLLELFAYITDTMIYRLNRLPEKVYVALLNLLGVRLMAPGAASTTLTFTRKKPGDTVIEIPRGTKVTAVRSTGGGKSPVFATAANVSIAADATDATVLAHHCDLIEAELAGIATGAPGMSVTAKRPPIVAPTGDLFDLLVGVEVDTEEIDEDASVQHEGKTFRIWREVEHFANLPPGEFVYVADRIAGAITFAPAIRQPSGDAVPDVASALAAVPPADREIRLWYRSGGGPDGNLAAGTLTTLKDQIAGVDVTNPAAATGGRPAETIENALVRGPLSIHSLERAVTSRDFQLVALRATGAVARARAFTEIQLWRHAIPGTVRVLLVPFVPEEARTDGSLTAVRLAEHQTPTALDEARAALDVRRPVATTVLVDWARCKTVRIAARVVVHREEDLAAVRGRVYARLHGSINPLPTRFNPSGWRFGDSLRASRVYESILAEPGVRYVDRLRMLVDDVPDANVEAVAADAFQAKTWYAGSGPTLFRSLNDGEGWEQLATFPGEAIDTIRPHPDRPGYLAAVSRLGDAASFLQVSADCGETWTRSAQLGFGISDMAWATRGGQPVLFLATSKGLYELTLGPNTEPIHTVVDEANPDRGLHGVAAATDAAGTVHVAVVAQEGAGVFLSSSGGTNKTFRPIGLAGEDTRVIEAQRDRGRLFLWVGTASVGADVGKGCFRWELRVDGDPPEGWIAWERRWNGGTCWGLAFDGNVVYAATDGGGILKLDTAAANAEWVLPDVRCGLPLRDPGRFHPVRAIAIDPTGAQIVSGGPEGVSRSRDDGSHYEDCSRREFTERVTLPPTWLFCCGEHELELVSEDAATRD
jgi:hypothetical protein